MKPSDFDYPLPKELIAQRPLIQRDASRLLVVHRKSGDLEDRKFSDITEYIPEKDFLVLNDTQVFPARLVAKKKKTGGRAEILLLHPSAVESSEGETWRCLVQPVLKEGQELWIVENEVEAVFLKRDKDGIPLVSFKGVKDVRELSSRLGTMPLPPYIKRDPDKEDLAAYQTVYADKPGAVAAPTAGLHLTKELLGKLKQKGVDILHLTLHVGYGTFKPVEDLENHQMHEEFFELSEKVAGQINAGKKEGRGVWAVGTTTLRVLETCVQKKKLIAGSGSTNLFIKEPFEFEATEHLVTNFHLPKTTLLLLVSAFMGEVLRKKAYDYAIEKKYRFYSYGDAMLII